MSATANTEKTRLKNAPEHFAAHVATMPKSHKLILLLGVVLAIAGGTGWLMTHASSDTGTRVTTVTTPNSPAGSSSFIDGRSAPADTSTSMTVRQTEPPSLIARISPNATRIGGSVVAGFVLGWIFRAFVKTMAFFALLAGAALMALSYFGVINVDLSSAREQYASVMHWLSDQGMRLKDAVIAHLPSSSGGAVGAYLGFRRR